MLVYGMFQHTAARRRLVRPTSFLAGRRSVSTHSRPKAAGRTVIRLLPLGGGFNTQPPEGGWVGRNQHIRGRCGFNTQPPEGGWINSSSPRFFPEKVSTHSRPKAAGRESGTSVKGRSSFNTQPPEGGWLMVLTVNCIYAWFQHTAARRRLENVLISAGTDSGFQHTAARRRLGLISGQNCTFNPVSTHSRPKAAG